MTPAGEIRAEEGRDAGLGHIGSNETSAHSENVRVIMLSGKRRRHGIVDPSAAALGSGPERSGVAASPVIVMLPWK